MTTKLLAVDDSNTMRKVLEITFAGDTYDSNIVGSAEAALAALRADGPQIAIVDSALGRTSGYDLCKQIKAEAPGTRVLLLSSKQRPYDEAQGSAAGVDGHFDKPFDSTKFLEQVSQLVASAPSPLEAKPTPPVQRPLAPPSRVSDAPPVAEAPRAVAPIAVTPVRAPAPEPRPAPVVAPVPAIAAPSPAPLAGADLAIADATTTMTGKLEDLGLTSAQVDGVLSLSRDVVEQVVWEVVPTLAETLIKEEIARLTSQ